MYIIVYLSNSFAPCVPWIGNWRWMPVFSVRGTFSIRRKGLSYIYPIVLPHVYHGSDNGIPCQGSDTHFPQQNDRIIATLAAQELHETRLLDDSGSPRQKVDALRGKLTVPNRTYATLIRISDFGSPTVIQLSTSFQSVNWKVLKGQVG